MTITELTTIWAIKITRSSPRDPVTGVRHSPENLIKLHDECTKAVREQAAEEIWQEALKAADQVIEKDNRLLEYKCSMSKNPYFGT